MKSLNLGGLPMHSIAITKAKQGYSEFGEVTLVFDKKMIDPQTDKNNKIYGSDAWTPIYPRVEYKASLQKEQELKSLYRELSKKYGYNEARPLYNISNTLEDELNSNNGERGLIKSLKDDIGLMQLYLLQSGKGKVDDIVKESRSETPDNLVGIFDDIIEKVGRDEILTPRFKLSDEEAEIRNHIDQFTDMDDSRSFEQLHYDESLENVVKVMKEEQPTGNSSLFSGLGIWGTAAKKYNSLEEVKADKGRLVETDDELILQAKQSIGSKLTDIADLIKNTAGKDQSMPTDYFEAKPRRAVDFNEITTAIIPDYGKTKKLTHFT